MAPTQPKVVVVLPTYNEKENIGKIIPALFALEIPNFHLLVVDDNSPDGTGAAVEKLAGQNQYANRINILHREEKQGLGPAYIEGFKLALSLGADFIIQMDADLSHPPKYIHQLLEKAQQYDIVIGSRYTAGGSLDERWGILRKLLSWGANHVYTPTILNIPVKDATSGYRIYRRDCLLGIPIERIKANGYVFMIELIYMAHRLGYRISEIPIHFPDRQYGTSKMSSTIALEAALCVWQIKYRHRSLKPSDRCYST